MHIIVMGVSGSGKSTVGEKLAESLHLPFLEGDSLHPKSNVDKMASGIPLQDEDRWPWLDKIGERMASAEQGLYCFVFIAEKELSGSLACSGWWTTGFRVSRWKL